MGIGHTYLLCLLFSDLSFLNTQFMASNIKTTKPTACAGAGKTALVEQFFNVIFTEFHSTPPVCVCVQMCPDQPTYCYPNGCLKKIDNKKRSPDDNRSLPGPNIQNVDSSNTLFLIDDKDDFMQVFNENVDGGKNAQVEKQNSVKDMRPDPFKDRYKILFKYKRMPIVELRYNLREQVKNMKSDILKIETKDVSKTRWPNGNHMILNEQRLAKINEKKNDIKTDNTEIANAKYIRSGSGSEDNTHESKYFKRDLRRNLKGNTESEVEFADKLDPLDSKNFSIETLIENLIGNNFEEKRDVYAEPNTEKQSTVKYDVKEEVTTPIAEMSDPKTNKSKDEITCVLSMNMTNQNLDKNKCTEDNPLVKERINKWKNYTFSEMIAAIAKRIDKQNNTSMEMMRQVSKTNVDVASENATELLNVENNLKSPENSSLHQSLLDEIQTVIITTKLENKNKTQESNRKNNIH